MPDEEVSASASESDSLEELRSRTESLETKFNELRAQSDARLIRAEMKAEAIRAGMIDLDCLQFVDLSTVKLNEGGEVAEAAALIANLRKSRPWMFASPSSSSLMSPPSVQPLRQKHATEMSDSEYATARAALIKQSY